MDHEQDRFQARALELMDAFASRAVEEVISPVGVKQTALKVSGRAHFVKLMRDFMIAENMVEVGDFKSMNQGDESVFGSMAHLNSVFREDQERRCQARNQPDRGVGDAAKAVFRALDPDIKKNLLGELRAMRGELAGRPTPEELAREAAAKNRGRGKI